LGYTHKILSFLKGKVLQYPKTTVGKTLEIFEQLLSELPKKVSFHERKLFLPEGADIFLCGPCECGKTSLALLHAAKKKEPYIYIHLKDFRLDSFDFASAYEFAASKKMSTIIFDGFEGEKFTPKKGIQTILVSNGENSIDGFETLKLGGLDFEEYLSFYEGRGQNKTSEEEAVAHIFADFIKDGSLPKIAEFSEFDKARYKTKLIRQIATTKTEELILIEFLRKTAMKFSLLQIFNTLKAKTKISKDFFYSYTQKLENMGVLFFVEKLHQKNSPKKIYSYDFTLKSVVDFRKDFSGIFENMVFLELNSRGYEAYYTDEAGLFVPEIEKTVLAKPFLPSDDEKMMAKLAKKAHELGIKEVEIITVSKEGETQIDGINIQTMPFWQWALSF
jgi:uncharacterized protein